MLKLYIDDVRDAIKGNQKANRALDIILAAANTAADYYRSTTSKPCSIGRIHECKKDCFDCNFANLTRGLV